jgi:hypothetical protein
MSYPHDDVFHGNHIAEVRNFLDERHPSAYLVFNLSGNGYDVAKLNNQVRLTVKQSSAHALHMC